MAGGALGTIGLIVGAPITGLVGGEGCGIALGTVGIIGALSPGVVGTDNGFFRVVGVADETPMVVFGAGTIGTEGGVCFRVIGLAWGGVGVLFGVSPTALLGEATALGATGKVGFAGGATVPGVFGVIAIGTEGGICFRVIGLLGVACAGAA